MKASAVRYLVDAGPLIGWLNRRDQWHEWSVQALRLADDRLWTSEAVFAEACYQLGQNSAEVDALIALVEGGQLEVLATVAATASRLRALMAKYPMMDICDATLVALSELYPRATIITLDVRDFTVYRRYRNEPIPLIQPN
ncbi:MAG: PIN domain-containing protein [Opitutaceae bacterium]